MPPHRVRARATSQVAARRRRHAAPDADLGDEQPRGRAGRRSAAVWLFDLDDTLHDASHAVFSELRESMTRYIEDELSVDRAQANVLRFRYWQRYGATLLGLVRHHGVSIPHFLDVTHRLPGLEDRLRAPAADRHALARLPGTRCVLTNAPRAYATRVLRALGILHLFHAVFSIEDMVIFGHLRPKPDVRMFRHLLSRLKARPADCVLVEDTLEHQRSAHRLGMATVWMQRYLVRSAGSCGGGRIKTARRPLYVGRRIRRLRDL